MHGLSLDEGQKRVSLRSNICPPWLWMQARGGPSEGSQPRVFFSPTDLLRNKSFWILMKKCPNRFELSPRVHQALVVGDWRRPSGPIRLVLTLPRPGHLRVEASYRCEGATLATTYLNSCSKAKRRNLSSVMVVLCPREKFHSVLIKLLISPASASSVSSNFSFWSSAQGRQGSWLLTGNGDPVRMNWKRGSGGRGHKLDALNP